MDTDYDISQILDEEYENVMSYLATKSSHSIVEHETSIEHDQHPQRKTTPENGAQNVGEQSSLKGSKSEIKSLYAVNAACGCCIKWLEIPETVTIFNSLDEEYRTVKVARETYAIVHRITKHDGDENWKTHSLEVNGSRLCSFLAKVLKKYPGANVGAFQAKFYPPFMSLFHRSKVLLNATDIELDEETKTQAQLLNKRLIDYWIPFLEDIVEFEKSGLMAFRSLWTIYPPGWLTVTKINDTVSAAGIQEVDIGNTLGISVRVINWNGSYCGYETVRHNIDAYSGVRKVTDLAIYPLRFSQSPQTLVDTLKERGRKFEALRGFHYKACSSLGPRNRVIIDAHAYYKYVKHERPSYKRLGVHKDEPSSTSSPSGEDSEGNASEPIGNYRKEDFTRLTDNQCLLTVPTVIAFHLHEKSWCTLNVSDIDDIVWNDTIFDQLAFDNGQKKLILALTQQERTPNDFDDFIDGNGKGITILLCGPPGVGKTLTSESVAEKTRAPIYTLRAGELGTDLQSVKSSLKKALNMCALWKAVLLIDEADVFLEARKPGSLKRNEIVCIFLRILEYHQGILFLTTNRITAIDPAFESRIDLIVPYPGLDEATRRSVWVYFVDKVGVGKHTLCDADLDELCKRDINGHEIKNALKTGIVLAKNEGRHLALRHLQIVLDARRQTTDYLRGLKA